MLYLRSAIFNLFFSAVSIGYSIAIVLASPIVSECALGHLGNAWSRTSLVLLRVICGLDIKVSGREHLPDHAVVILSKHSSAWETVALRPLFPCRQAWVLKRELLSIPFFGWALGRFHPIAIDRNSPRQALKQVLTQGEISLKANRWVVLFPEGTRVAPGERGRYNISGAKLAERTGTDVLPIAHNSGVFWGRRAFTKRPGCIHLVVGAPISSQNRSAAEINRLAEDWIETTVASLPDLQTRN
ncbi:lysophospholipid acyltransferase family protein [Thiorhodovibrio frisius]|uniref:1-acyl-sn-glycerol-3-phosphate acyltransferase n=1 Tax=Thiorhodovibrio frisius TaxID=631362 RepID=H8YZH4_9GAMM|nr:lysophospholipid acyltransferase family protein [Thiorhodovibrio frisius]EIC22101.1 1-acyl-sn-glycerol-3-phosphate acyltransferase [Thiorhodovibrio frisius]WPL24394.1 1-acyl-sn-glycerol-3-phosphate acyltransferase [Thiorhodovibrio frisius]